MMYFIVSFILRGLIFGGICYFVGQFYLFPLLIGLFIECRASELSLLSGKEIEYRSKAQRRSNVPTIRVESFSWAWGGFSADDVGLLVLKIDGLSYRHSDDKEEEEDTSSWIGRLFSKLFRQLWSRIPISRIITYFIHLFIHHYPSVGRIISVHVSDARIILDTHDGLEITIKEFRLGAKVHFEGNLETTEAPVPQSPTSPFGEYRRLHPLSIPDELSPPSSPPGSPISQFSSFALPGDAAEPMPDVGPSPRQSRMADTRRRASVFQSRMLGKANRMWARAIGRAHGSVTFTASIQDVALILPHDGHTTSESATAGSESPQKGSNGNGLSHRASTKSFGPDSPSQPRTFRSVGSFHSILRPQTRSVPPIPAQGYEKLASLAGRSTAVLGLGFGPKKGLLGEDTLRATIELGTLDTTLGAVQKLQALMEANKSRKEEAKKEEAKKEESKKEKSKKEESKKKESKKAESASESNLWSPDGLPRTILRAFESVSVSLARMSVTHRLPVPSSSPVSARSSVTDMSDFQAADDAFTLSLDASLLYCKLDAADSLTDPRARNAFGTNPSAASKVRGVGYSFGWKSVAVQCLAPGEKSNEMSQLLQMRSAEFDGLSTWRPRHWSREELLFASDPNLALVVQKGLIDSIDVAGDVQLLDELRQAWAHNHPRKAPKPASEPSLKSPALPPRVRIVMDIGHAMVLLADRNSEQKTTLTLASDGLHFGCFTTFADINARRRDKTENKAAFKREEELEQRREEAGDQFKPAQPVKMLRPEHRRHFSRAPAVLQDDYSISMKAEATVVLEPMSLHMTLSDPGSRDQQTYELASIGRAHGTLTGDILGTTDVEEDHTDVMSLDYTSLSCAVDVGVDSGVKLKLWNMPVIDALVSMASAHRNGSAAEDPILRMQKEKKTMLARLPTGVSARLSLGLVSVFIGHEDPNPNCDLKLTRGIWLQTTFLGEYAFYTREAQVTRRRQVQLAAHRAALQLQDDITTQAQAFETHYSPADGRAALMAVTLTNTTIRPIFNGKRFMEHDGDSINKPTSVDPAAVPKEKDDDDFDGWEFFRRTDKGSATSGYFANNTEPFEISDTDQAKRPLLAVKRANVRWVVLRPETDADTEYRCTSRVDEVDVVADLSHAYCGLLAATTIKRIVDAKKATRSMGASTSTATSETHAAPTIEKHPRNFTVEIVVPAVRMHFAFPLREQLYVFIGNTTISKPAYKPLQITAKKVLGFVPAPRVVGSWEELVRIKELDVRSTPPTQPLGFAINAQAMRVRIPVSYQLSRLVLNINVTIKTMKLLTRNLDGRGFQTVFRPGPEAPKRVPSLLFNIERMSFEAKDHPIETNLNLIWRAGMAEQEKRNELEDMFEAKIKLLQEAAMHDGSHNPETPNGSKLTPRMTTTLEDARHRLDWHKAKMWTRRIRQAQDEQKRREQAGTQHLASAGLGNTKLPITIARYSHSAPLFRLCLDGVALEVGDLGWSREKIMQYMGDVSSPFDPDTEFSLMIPLRLQWTMRGGVATLRDYPLPLIRIPEMAGKDGWSLDTPFIIAEELVSENMDDTLVMVPTLVVPEGCGAKQASAFSVQVAKTIMPVKTYSRPVINVLTDRTTEFTWGSSYQPAIQDFMKVIESLSHPPRDPSERVGFWDKFRLILHWKVTVKFKGNVHLHLKGTHDPYAVVGYGAGFALSWKGDTKFEINMPNEQHEVIQISAEQLLIAIPDLSALHDNAAMGNEKPQKNAGDENPPPHGAPHEEQSLIERRYTKPCARFLNGVRVGFGFVLEATCRPWNCKQRCGHTDNLLHRQCRFFTFKPHQEVILRNPEAIERMEHEAGHTIDSYEGFRSDYIHFSVSVVAPLNQPLEKSKHCAENQNSLHLSPKAFAHFFNWWAMFDHKMSLPIRQGKMFPDSPPPSKKFGRSLGTIKYRFSLAPVYISHMYSQVSRQMCSSGKAQSLGIKGRIDKFNADAHQRTQEQAIMHPLLNKNQVIRHKAFYAADLLCAGIEVKGIRADFVETPNKNHRPANTGTKASELEEGKRSWWNWFDFIDADKKPLDRDPEVEVVDFMDCPQVFFSKRNKVRQSSPEDDVDEDVHDMTEDERTMIKDDRAEESKKLGVVTSKFGHEKSHICYLGAVKSVGETQLKITKARIRELEERKRVNRDEPSFDHRLVESRLKTLYKHVEHLAHKEDRHIDDDTFEPAEPKFPVDRLLGSRGEMTFENTFHVHCPRVYYNNLTRNIIFKYWFSSRDRRQEEYMTSHKSLRGIREGIQSRIERINTGLNQDDLPDEAFPLREDAATDLLTGLQKVLSDRACTRLFNLPEDNTIEQENLHTPSLGLPEGTTIKPSLRVLVLKPQIALRSEIDESSVILLAVEEVGFKGFVVLDDEAKDSINADVLGRHYISMKGLQAFYPTKEALQREREQTAKNQRGLDFIPLEIFLDVRSEAQDYDRIVLKTDAAISFDRFNHLRMPRGMDWPVAKDEWGQEIQHLRMHQDLVTIIVPRMHLTATSKHYSALYNVVTDLLLYQDPGHRERAERIDNFQFAFDRSDRDPQKLIFDLFSLQHSIRSLRDIQRGYDANVDLLNEEGLEQLFRIRTDLLEALEQLFTVFEAISVNKARDEARAALKSASRLDVRVGGIAWHMLREDLAPLLKIDIEGALFSAVSNKDGSNDSAMACGDLSALNSDSEAMYPEVLVRYDSGGVSKKKTRESFASAAWSILAPVGGITIVRHLALYIYPVRFRLEENVGHQVMDYIFTDRVERRKARKEEKEREKAEKHNHGKHKKGDKSGHDADSQADGKKSGNALWSTNGVEGVPLSRTKSSSSVATTTTMGTSASGDEIGKKGAGCGDDEKFRLVPTKDATEMRKRASANKTFVRIVFGATSFVLSYKSDETKKKSSRAMFSVPDCVDLKLKTPEMAYGNQVWANEDVFEHVKRDIRSYMWSQSGDLLGQLLKKTSLFRSKKGLKSLALSSSDMLPRHKSSSAHSPSSLRYTVEPPTPLEEESTSTSPLSIVRALSREPSSPLSRTRSRALSNSPGPSSAQIMGIPLHPAPSRSSGNSTDSDVLRDEVRGDEENGGLGIGQGAKAVKGFLSGKLKKYTSKFDLPSHGSDDVERHDRALSHASEKHERERDRVMERERERERDRENREMRDRMRRSSGGGARPSVSSPPPSYMMG